MKVIWNKLGLTLGKCKFEFFNLIVQCRMKQGPRIHFSWTSQHLRSPLSEKETDFFQALSDSRKMEDKKWENFLILRVFSTSLWHIVVCSGWGVLLNPFNNYNLYTGICINCMLSNINLTQKLSVYCKLARFKTDKIGLEISIW